MALQEGGPADLNVARRVSRRGGAPGGVGMALRAVAAGIVIEGDLCPHCFHAAAGRGS